MWFWRYELRPRRPLAGVARAGPRSGALLKVGSGYADVHPWPELGDAPIEDQLAILARGETTPLTAASLRFAAADAEARERGESLFSGLVIPESHWSWDGSPVPSGFDTVKVKMSRGATIDHQLERYTLRLDYNARLTAAEFLDEHLPDASIDFIEDPCPYDATAWREIRTRRSVRLALDRPAADPEAADVVVIKPAVQEVPITSREIVVTSYLDHPVGQLAAAWVAARHATSRRCGLLTHVLYEDDPFVEQLGIEGARLVPPEGTGVGYDRLLARLDWRRLS